MKKIRIAALGDSLTKGVVLTERDRYSILDNSFMDIIGRELDLQVENYGKFGCTVAFGNTVLERHVESISSSDYTFIEYGGNDCDFDWLKISQYPSENHDPKTTLSSFKTQVCGLVEKVRSLGSEPVIVSLPPIVSDLYFSFFSRSMSARQKENVINWLGGDVEVITRWHESYNRALFDVARMTNTHIIDITTPFDTYRGHLSALYCSDGIHPNENGHRLIAESIVNMHF